MKLCKTKEVLADYVTDYNQCDVIEFVGMAPLWRSPEHILPYSFDFSFSTVRTESKTYTKMGLRSNVLL
jgi:hypothetical protein